MVSASLYTTVPKMQRLDMWPFAIVWGIYIAATLAYGIIHSTELHLLCGGLIGVLQALAMLCSQWSVAMRCVLQGRRVSASACVAGAPCTSVLASSAGAPAGACSLVRRARCSWLPHGTPRVGCASVMQLS